MTLFDLILIAVSLSMDAFAVSICKGLSVRKVSLQHAMICGVWFGGFQFLMPALGYFLGDRFAALLTKFGPWIAFVLLALIGANMIKESFGGDEQLDGDYSAQAMLPLAIATSIDAFAVGVSFAAMQVDILPAAGLIGVITCLLSAIGVKVGAMFGDKYRAPAERIGGIVLILSRFIPIIGQVALAGLLAQKRYIPESAGTLKTDTVTFAVMTFAVIFIVAALSFFPAQALTTLTEHFTL